MCTRVYCFEGGRIGTIALLTHSLFFYTFWPEHVSHQFDYEGAEIVHANTTYWASRSAKCMVFGAIAIGWEGR